MRVWRQNTQGASGSQNQEPKALIEGKDMIWSILVYVNSRIRVIIDVCDLEFQGFQFFVMNFGIFILMIKFSLCFSRNYREELDWIYLS